MQKRVAVVGVGMQKFERKKVETVEEMVFDVTKKALDDCKLRPDDIGAVVFGSAVDAFCGIHQSDKLLTGAAAGLLKPCLRNATSGSTAVSTPIVAYTHIASGMYKTILCICYEKMSENHAAQDVFNATFDEIFCRQIGLNVPIFCSLDCRRYLHRYGITEEQMAKVSVRNRGNALDNPYAHMAANLTVQDVLNSPYLSKPIKLLDTSSVSDGARAAVFASEDVVKDIDDDPVWVRGVGRGADSCWFMGRTNWDLGRLDYAYLAAQQAYEQADIKNPQKEIDAAEVYDPFTFKEMEHCEALGLCEEGGAGRANDEGIFLRDGKLPVNPSGGLQGEGNPIGAGMSRFCWAYLQIKGRAGGCQVKHKDVNTAVCNAWGGVMQYSAAMVLGRD